MEFAEIGGGGALEAMVAVDGGVDLGGRKSEPIFGWGVLQAFHFTELQEGRGFLHGGLVCRFAGGLELLQDSEVLLDGAVQALLVEGEELELLRLLSEDVRHGEGGVDLGNVGAGLAAILKLAEGEEVVFNGADPIQTPAVGGDALGELGLHGSVGGEARNEGFGELVVGGAVFVGHGGDLAGEAVTECVEAGAVAASVRTRTC